ncbi:MAG: hypothetical protein ABS874_05660 [Lachnospiraceae bacterium]
MNTFNQKISEIGVVPVIKLNHPERDAAGLAKALCAGALAMTTPGDTSMASVNEVEAIMGGAGARVKR